MAQSFYYLDQYKKDFPEDYLDSIQYELDTKIYYYGNQYRRNIDSKSYKRYFLYGKKKLADIYKLSRDLKLNRPKNEIYALSNAYFGLESYLKDFGIETLRMPWLGVDACSWQQYKIIRNYQNYLSKSSFIELLSKEAIGKYYKVIETLTAIYSQEHIKYICLSQDMTPFERMSIKVFKELGKKSLVFLHGLPGRYNNLDDNRSDYLVVWGEKTKELYVKAGIRSNKIFVSGHPRYTSFNVNTMQLRMDFSDILVIAKPMSGQHSDKIRLADRGNLILYLSKIQSVLKSLGVNSVRLRPHPSMDAGWFYSFIDKAFFKEDTERDINESLKKSSLVIGATSSVFLDALFAGVNYLIFEPAVNGTDLVNFPIVPPFDQSDKRAVVSQTEDELREALLNRLLVDPSILQDYIKPGFDLSFIKNLVD